MKTLEILRRLGTYETLREIGIFKSPGKLYPSMAITEEDIALTEAAIEAATAEIASG